MKTDQMQTRAQSCGLWLTTALALLLLWCVAWGETTRTLQRFEHNRLRAAADSIRLPLQAHGQAGLPVSQFAGFAVLAADLKRREPSVKTVALLDAQDQPLAGSDRELRGLERITMTVSGKFDTLGYLQLGIDPASHLSPVMAWVVQWAIGLTLCLVALAVALSLRAGRGTSLAFGRFVLLGLLSLQMALMLPGMWQLYAAGVRSTAQTVADGVLSRVAGVYEDGLALSDFADLPQWLDSFRQGETGVVDVILRVDDQPTASSNTPDSAFSPQTLTQVSASAVLRVSPPVSLQVQVGVPTTRVHGAIARNLKNMLALLLATTLLAMVVLRLQHTRLARSSGARAVARHESGKIAAVLFGGVFCDQLTAAFLPVWVAQQAQADAWPPAWVAWPFTLYFVCFAGVLLPVQRHLWRIGLVRAVQCGTACIGLSALLLLVWPSFESALLSRALAGLGQGMVFVAVQTGLLAWARHPGGVDASRSIVSQFNAAMICGLALGSLLVVYVEASGVFAVVFALAVLTGGVAVTLHSPRIVEAPQASLRGATVPKPLLSARLLPWFDGGFAWPALLVGIPSKAVMTGVIVYATPVLLSGAGFEKEEVGQILMLYAVGVLSSNRVLRGLLVGLHHQRVACSVAMLVSGLSVWGLSHTLADADHFLPFPMLLAGLLGSVLLLGFCHGAVNAPVVNLVTDSATARQLGPEVVATTYRLFERVGHVLGPVTVAACLHQASDAHTGLLWVAYGLVLCGVLFALLSWAGSRTRAGMACVLLCLGLGGLLSPAPAHATQPVVQGDKAHAIQTPWLRLDAALRMHWSVDELSSTTPDVAETGNGLLLTPRRQQGPWQNRLVLFLVPRASPAYDVAVSSFLNAWADMGMTPKVQIVHTAGQDDLARAAMRAARQQAVSLVVAVGSDMAAWLHRHHRQGPTPIVTVCAKDPVLMGQLSRYDQGGGESMAYTSLNMPVDVQLSYLQRLIPGLRQLAIVVDRQNSSAWQTQTLPLQALAEQLGIRVHRVVVDGTSDVAAQLHVHLSPVVTAMRAADPAGAGGVIWITGSSSVFPHLGIINRLSARLPVLSAVPELVQAGADSAAASIGIGFEQNAQLAARYAARVLRGEVRAGDLPVGVVTPPEIAIHVGRIRHAGLRLPFSFYENASTLFDAQGVAVRVRGSRVRSLSSGDSE